MTNINFFLFLFSSLPSENAVLSCIAFNRRLTNSKNHAKHL